MIVLKGTYQITGWDEKAYNENEDGSKQSLAKITCTFSGDIEGTSEVQYLMAYGRDGTANFSGFETITCKVNGKQGQLVLQHAGKYENSVATSEFSILSNAGAGELQQASGTGSYQSTENGQANYKFELML